MEMEARKFIRRSIALQHLLKLKFLDEGVFLLECLCQFHVFILRGTNLLILVLDQTDNLLLILHQFINLLNPVVVLTAHNLAVLSRERVQRVARHAQFGHVVE